MAPAQKVQCKKIAARFIARKWVRVSRTCTKNAGPEGPAYVLESLPAVAASAASASEGGATPTPRGQLACLPVTAAAPSRRAPWAPRLAWW
jgi:hypothetical protein